MLNYTASQKKKKKECDLFATKLSIPILDVISAAKSES